jgi:hypothetical protein
VVDNVNTRIVKSAFNIKYLHYRINLRCISHSQTEDKTWFTFFFFFLPTFAQITIIPLQRHSYPHKHKCCCPDGEISTLDRVSRIGFHDPGHKKTRSSFTRPFSFTAAEFLSSRRLIVTSHSPINVSSRTIYNQWRAKNISPRHYFDGFFFFFFFFCYGTSIKWVAFLFELDRRHEKRFHYNGRLFELVSGGSVKCPHVCIS